MFKPQIQGLIRLTCANSRPIAAIDPGYPAAEPNHEQLRANVYTYINEIRLLRCKTLTILQDFRVGEEMTIRLDLHACVQPNLSLCYIDASPRQIVQQKSSETMNSLERHGVTTVRDLAGRNNTEAFLNANFNIWDSPQFRCLKFLGSITTT